MPRSPSLKFSMKEVKEDDDWEVNNEKRIKTDKLESRIMIIKRKRNKKRTKK